MHEDGPAYRLAAIRETFEESGILLARRLGQAKDQGLLQVPDDVRDAGRKLVHGSQVKFTEWLKGVGGEPDVGKSHCTGTFSVHHLQSRC